jgi:hypothetical protein
MIYTSGEVYTPNELKSYKVHFVPELRSRKPTVAELSSIVDTKESKSRRYAVEGLFEQKR